MRKITQKKLIKAGFSRQQDDYDRDSPTSEKYEIWYEIWERPSEHNPELTYHYCCTRKYEYGKWYYDSELLELMIPDSFAPLLLSIDSIGFVEGALFRRKEG